MKNKIGEDIDPVDANPNKGMNVVVVIYDEEKVLYKMLFFSSRRRHTR